MSVPWYANQPISGQLLGEVPEFTATVLVSDACGMSADVEWVWALVSNVSPFKILFFLETSVRNLTLPGQISVAALGLPASGFLVPGDVYAVALLEASADGSLANLAEAATRGLRFARSVPFVADGAPHRWIRHNPAKRPGLELKRSSSSPRRVGTTRTSRTQA